MTITRFVDIEEEGIYTDLMRKFRDEGHNVYVVSPLERRYKTKTTLQEKDGVHLLGVKTLNIQKTNVIEKGIGTILVEFQFKRDVEKYLGGIKFDLILSSTPPITFTKVIKSLKTKYAALSYLLLKDIFPQNAVDLGMFSKYSLIYKFFRKKEKDLYRVSDYIGCLSPANIRFLLKNNSYLSSNKIEVNSNSIELSKALYKDDKAQIRSKYSIPQEIITFVYGGNLGKPQAIDFLIEVLAKNTNRKECFFLIVGSGTEYSKIEQWFIKNNPTNAKLMSSLPKEDYNSLVRACDVGLIFLDYRFTIPNYPCRLLSYLENKMPILAATDVNTDVGKIAEENGYGYCCESRDIDKFTICLDKFILNKDSISTMGEKGYQYLLDNYTVDRTYQIIMQHLY